MIGGIQTIYRSEMYDNNSTKDGKSEMIVHFCYDVFTLYLEWYNNI